MNNSLICFVVVKVTKQKYRPATCAWIVEVSIAEYSDKYTSKAARFHFFQKNATNAKLNNSGHSDINNANWWHCLVTNLARLWAIVDKTEIAWGIKSRNVYFEFQYYFSLLLKCNCFFNSSYLFSGFDRFLAAASFSTTNHLSNWPPQGNRLESSFRLRMRPQLCSYLFMA